MAGVFFKQPIARKDFLMDLDLLARLKRLAIIAMFSDDDLMDILVLKGGNLLDSIYAIAYRSSMDVDFSMEGEFDEGELNAIVEKIRKALTDTFKAEGFMAFDINFLVRPKKPLSPDVRDFWGGYRVEFKVIETEKYEKVYADPRALRMAAISLGKRNEKKFFIDISKFEFCFAKRAVDLEEGYTIYVYTPEMLVCEKIRAICQQMPEYVAVVPNVGKSARARDFFDIYTILQHWSLDIAAQDNLELLRNIFAAKRVPVELIQKIPEYRDFHRPDFSSVRDTVKVDVELQDFDFYFDYVVEKLASLKALWEK